MYETGRYTIAVSLAALVSGLTDLGLTGVGLRELSVLRGERRAAFTRELLGMRLTFALLGVLLVTRVRVRSSTGRYWGSGC